MELELKYLAQLAANKAKCHVSGEHTEETEYDDNPEPKVFIICGFYLDSGNEIMVQLDIDGDKEEAWIGDVFPILHPPSDLTKEIEHNGGLFIPVRHLFYDWRKSLILKMSFDYGTLTNLRLDYPNGAGDFIQESNMTIIEWNKLFEWHFDIYGLIDAGLAIDINTL